MKKVVYSMLVVSLALFSCGGEEKKDEKKDEKKEEKQEEVAEKAMWTVDPAASTVEWNGYKGDDPTNDAHLGMVSISEGSIVTEGTKITGGNFKIDMNTLKETTEGADPTYSEKLIKHLGNEDFFNVASFPVAELNITAAEDKKVMAELMVLGKSVPVEIPYEINVDGERASITAEFSVDFTSLGLPGTALEEGGDPADKISDKVNFTVRLAAIK
ncbi:MAG: YceI family protein [Crocinitomicaceae bacterium]|nr:YceI family protein [Crocinitomicaceae bacterium]